MTPNGVAALLGRLNFLYPDAKPLEKNQELFETWLTTLKPIEDDEMAEALPILAQSAIRRPSIAELIQSAKAVRAGRFPLALPAPKPSISPYGKAWQAVGKAVMERRFPRAEMEALIDQHTLWFDRYGSDNPATSEMLAEVQAMASKANAVSSTPPVPGKPKFQSRYSDAHIAQYLANSEAHAAAKEKP